MSKRSRRRATIRSHDHDQDRGTLMIRDDDHEPVSSPIKSHTLDAPNVLRLQGTIGNQAVQRMIAQQKNTAPANVVQRGIYDWMIETAETIARPYIELGKAIWEKAQAEKATQANPTPASTSAHTATDALEKAAEQEIKLAEAKLLTEDQASVERQRALDQARFTAEEQKELDAIGIEKLRAELKAKRGELGKLMTSLGKSRTSLGSLKTQLKKTKKQDKIDELNGKIAELTKTIDKDAETEKTLQKRIGELDEIVRKHGYKGAMDKMQEALGGEAEMVKWFNDFDPNATFLGVKVVESDKSRVEGVHKKMTDALQKAEAHLMSLPQFAGKDKLEVAAELGIRRVSGLRQPKKSASSDNISLHCYGLAIDINAMANPYVGLNTYEKDGKKASFTAEVIMRAGKALGRGEKNIRTLPSRDTGEMWDFLEAASDSLRDYIALIEDTAGLEAAVQRLNAADGTSLTAADLKKQIEEDYQWLKGKGDFAAATKSGEEERDPAKGFMDLPKELVVALVEVGGLTWGGTFKTAKDIQHFQLDGVVASSGD